MSILDHPLVTERYFFPRSKQFDNPFWVEVDGARLSCYYHKKEENKRTIVFFHGNGELITDYIDTLVPMFDRMGFNVFLAEYRGYAMSTGTPRLVEMLADIEPIIEATGVEPENIVVFGRSVGSIYAIHAVHKFPEIKGLVLESGVADMLQRIEMRLSHHELGVSIDEFYDEFALEFNHEIKLGGYRNPVLIMHALHDQLVDSGHADHLYEWANEPKRLTMFSKGDHNDVMYQNLDEYVQQLYSFLWHLDLADESIAQTKEEPVTA